VAGALELFQFGGDAGDGFLYWRNRFGGVLFHLRQTLHDRRDRFCHARLRAIFAIEHALAEVTRELLMPLIDALGHARDLLADVLNGLRTARLDCANAFLKAFGEAPDLDTHAVEASGFASLDFVETRLQRGRHAGKLFAYRRCGGVIVTRLDGPQALV